MGESLSVALSLQTSVVEALQKCAKKFVQRHIRIRPCRPLAINATVPRFQGGGDVMRIVVTALVMTLLGGCATANETFGNGQLCGLHPYCGAATDIEVIKATTAENAGALRVLAPLAIIDLPFSIVADTLILPYTIFHMKPAEE